MPRKKKKTVTKIASPKKKKTEALVRVTGMHDLLPDDFIYFDYVLDIIKKLTNIYSFLPIETPVLEKTDLFSRSIGKETDIVSKEMFSFTDKGGDDLTLRPEWTAGIARAYLENGLFQMTQPLKLFSYGPLFRRERPQAGRYRQFHQANFEILGGEKPVLDTEIIYLGWNIFKKIGFKDVEVHLNSIGCPECRPEYLEILVNYLTSKRQRLCGDCKIRLKKNPLRVLDCKRESCQAVVNEAPQSIDYLCEPCHDHFKNLLEYLDEIQVIYHLNPKLVRGLDYYNRTTFEFVLKEKDKSTAAIAGGGRYDGLFALLGGRPTPAVGFAIGIERVVEKVKERNLVTKKEKGADVFLVQLGELSKKKSLKIFQELVEANIKVKCVLSKDSIKSQLRLADRFNVKLSLILGQKEALEESIMIRDMQSGIQESIPLSKLVDEVKRRLKKIGVAKKK